MVMTVKNSTSQNIVKSRNTVSVLVISYWTFCDVPKYFLNELKLSKIKLKRFGGDISDYLDSWSQFQRIHNDPDLQKNDKLTIEYRLQHGPLKQEMS